MLTATQLLTLKSAILGETDPQFVEYRTLGVTAGMAQFYNEIASPAFIVWKTNVVVDDIMRGGIDWTRVDNLSVGKSRIWDWMTKLGVLDASKPNVRAGIDATWAGTAADLAVRATVYTFCKRSATRGEKLFATGTGTDPAPAVMAVEGEITEIDVLKALSA